MEGYTEVSKLLQHRRTSLVSRLADIQRDAQRADKPLDRDFAEQAVERENDEVLDALETATRTEIDQIDDALQRIEQGSYGTCSLCGEPIPEGRLKILPFSDRCVSCADEP